MLNNELDFQETHPHSQVPTMAESIEDEDLSLLLTSEELLDEMSADVSLGEVEGVPPLDKVKRRGPVLTKQQQLQLCVWILEGFKHRQMVPVMEKHWGHAVGEGTWRYYKGFRKDLQRDAAAFLESQYLTQGFATRAVRVRKLGRLLDHVEDYMTENGLSETDEHVTGYGKQQGTVKTVKFAANLVREYREGLKLMEHWLAPVEHAVKGHKDGDAVAVDKETADQFLLASGWNPAGSESS